MKINLLLPSYNSEKTINRCIDSIFNQTYQDYNIIFLNDCSTDNTMKLVKEYNDSRIKIYENNTNKGRGYSRNKLLDLSDTEISCWIDSDDWMHPEKLEKQITYMKNSNCDFLSTEMFDTRNGITVGNGCNLSHMINDLTLENLNVSNCINHPTVMFRTEIAKQLKFKDSMTFNEDWDFYIRLYENGKKVECLPEKLYYYNL
jgi:glycosyltransferase involved in cell wall biosynthesis